MQHAVLTRHAPPSCLLQAKLNALDPTLFPLCDASANSAAAAELPANCVVGANMLRYHLRPVAKKGIDAGGSCAISAGGAALEGAIVVKTASGSSLLLPSVDSPGSPSSSRTPLSPTPPVLPCSRLPRAG